MSRVTLFGKVTKQPTTKQVGSTQVTQFSLKETETVSTTSGEEKDISQTHFVTAWGKLSEKLSLLSVGETLYIEGKIVYESYEDKDGNKKYTTKINATDIKFCN